jgi:signal transduction histidine kinase/ActR/RegA family two-component response regulator
VAAADPVPVVVARRHHRLVARDIAAEERREHELVAQTALRVRDWVNQRLDLLAIVERLTLEERLQGQGGWSWLDPMVEAADGIQAVNWIDAQGVISALSPSAGNEKALHRSVYDNPVAGPQLRAAFATGTTRISSPLDLFQGRRGFTVYHPVQRDGVVLGAVNGVFRIEALERLCLTELARSHALILRDGESALSTMGPPVTGRRVARAAIPVLDRSWELQIEALAPGPSFVRSAPVLGVLLLGFFVVALLLHAVLRREEEAEDAVRSRTAMALRLQETERLEALGRLAGAVAHDVNNVLTVMRAHMDLLADEALDGIGAADVALHVAAVDTAAEKGAALTGKLLAFARKQPVTVGTVEVVAHLKEQRRMLDGIVGGGCKLLVELPETELEAELPGDSLDRVLVNLLMNARDALPAGQGTITVTVALEGGRALVAVEDDGPGMPQAVLDKAFEPFFTTRAEGTGLGLATVHGLVHQAGGTVHIASEVGVGTRVEVRLPLAVPARDEPARPAVSSPGVTTAGARLRVLLVEDDPLVRGALAQTIAAQGHDALPFADAEEALAHAPRSDVLVTDLVFPGMTGVSLARQLQRRWPKLRLIMVSGYASQPGDADEIVAMGARFLPKPYSPRQLRAVLEEIRDELAAEGPLRGAAQGEPREE